MTLLQSAGHDVQTTTMADLNDENDEVVLAHAFQQNRIVLTFNCDDFRALDTAGHPHIGILAVYRNNNVVSDMQPADIVNAIANLEASDWDFTGQFVALNAWHYARPAAPP